MFSRRLIVLTRSAGSALVVTILLGWVGGVLTILQAWFLASIINQAFLGGVTLVRLVTPLATLAV